MDRSIERAALNETIFRDANELIEDRRRQLGTEARIPYLCECEDEECLERVHLTADEYADVRSSPRRFVLAKGHQFTSGKVVTETDSYLVVDKVGGAGEIAEHRAGADT
jgi:hypothetical protein